jgi:hypothetical protein
MNRTERPICKIDEIPLGYVSYNSEYQIYNIIKSYVTNVISFKHSSGLKSLARSLIGTRVEVVFSERFTSRKNVVNTNNYITIVRADTYFIIIFRSEKINGKEKKLENINGSILENPDKIVDKVVSSIEDYITVEKCIKNDAK